MHWYVFLVAIILFLNKAIAFNRMLIALLLSSSNETEKKQTNKNPPTHKIALKSEKCLYNDI